MDAFNEAKQLEARWKEVEREQKEVYQVRHRNYHTTKHGSTLSDSTMLKRFSPQFLLMRLKHATTAQDELSEALGTSFVQGSSSDPTGNGKDIDDFVKEFKELRKTYHKRVMWGDRWSTGQVH